MANALFVKNVRFLVTCDDSNRILEHGDMLVRDGVIAQMGTGLQAPADAQVLDATGMILYPGLINTHHHLYQTFSRNLPQVQRMELFPWLKTLYEIWKNLDDESVYYSTITGAGELLKHGCTTCLDHHYVFPQGRSAGFLDAQFAAADALGIRFHATRGSMDLSVKDGGLPPDSVVQPLDEILRDSQLAVEKFHDPSRYAMHQVALAPCSPFSVSEALLRESAALARSLGVRLHTHLAETKTGVAHCPISNMKLSSGVAQVPRMLELGVPVGLAVDGSASNDGSDMLEELRVAYLLHRLAKSEKAPTGEELLRVATRGSAALLGRDDLGYLAPGMAADFFLVRADRLEFTGALGDVAALPAVVGIKNAVDYTVVNGKIVVRDGHLALLDEAQCAADAGRAVAKYLQRA